LGSWRGVSFSGGFKTKRALEMDSLSLSISDGFFTGDPEGYGNALETGVFLHRNPIGETRVGFVYRGL